MALFANKCTDERYSRESNYFHDFVQNSKQPHMRTHDFGDQAD